MHDPERWWEGCLEMCLLLSPVQMDMPNTCYTKGHVASFLPGNTGQGYVDCQSETILIFLLVFSSKPPIPYQTFSLISFCVRVIETASISYNSNCTDHLREYHTVFKHMVSNARQARIKFHPYLLPALGPWENHFTSLCFCFLMYKQG